MTPDWYDQSLEQKGIPHDELPEIRSSS